jgi:purine-binding chemotaxis protein CheW
MEMENTQHLAGKYLTFALGQEGYGLAILKVQEIIGLMKVTQVPRTPDYIRGVINLRGRVIPVVSLRIKFEMESAEDTDRTCIVVVEVARGQQALTMGILVDAVSEVVDIANEQIEPPPAFGSAVDTTFILGMAKLGDRVVTLLDIDRVLTDRELATVGQVEETP